MYVHHDISHADEGALVGIVALQRGVHGAGDRLVDAVDDAVEELPVHLCARAGAGGGGCMAESARTRKCTTCELPTKHGLAAAAGALALLALLLQLETRNQEIYERNNQRLWQWLAGALVGLLWLR